MMFWEYIKGCSNQDTTTHVTQIQWSDATTTDISSDYAAAFRCSPALTYGGTSLGRFLTSKAQAQFRGANCLGDLYIAGDIVWMDGVLPGPPMQTCHLYLGLKNVTDIESNSTITYSQPSDYVIYMSDSTSHHRKVRYESRLVNNKKAYAFEIDGGVFRAGSEYENSTKVWNMQTDDQGIIIQDSARKDASVILKNSGGQARIHAYEANAATVGITWDERTNPVSFSSGGLIQGAYFNATSDRRAKTNIEYLHKPILSLVKNTPICTFTYKDSQKTSLGIIAQDLEDVDLNGVPLVENIQASGKDGDYMTIRESKLVYVLWKAIQEQQKQIEELQTQIQQLKKD